MQIFHVSVFLQTFFVYLIFTKFPSAEHVDIHIVDIYQNFTWGHIALSIINAFMV